MNKYELVLASEIFDDDNNGYEYGINWLWGNGEIIDCEWFKTAQKRYESLKREKENSEEVIINVT